jgi:hypothetical protein
MPCPHESLKRRLPLPIVVTFDLTRPEPHELNRIRGAFERLGWEHLGNTVYRYPRLRDTPTTEDWFNRVIPALMLLRALARHAAETGRAVVRFTIDAQSSTGFNQEATVGWPALPANEIGLIRPSGPGEAMGRQRLQDWLDGIAWPYAPEPQDAAAAP